MTDWWKDHNNLAALWAWLDEEGCPPEDGPAYFMEKPWKYQAEWTAYQTAVTWPVA